MMCELLLTELLPLLRENDPMAWNRVADLLLPQLRRFGAAICRDSHQVEDGIQETFRIVMYRVLGISKNHPEPLKELKVNYFFVVLKDQLRPHRPRKVDVEFHPSDEFEPTDNSPAPEELADGNLKQEIVRRAIATLDPAHAEVITLRCFDDLSLDEIADRLQKSESATHSLFRRAQNSLSRAVARLLAEEDR